MNRKAAAVALFGGLVLSVSGFVASAALADEPSTSCGGDVQATNGDFGPSGGGGYIRVCVPTTGSVEVGGDVHGGLNGVSDAVGYVAADGDSTNPTPGSGYLIVVAGGPVFDVYGGCSGPTTDSNGTTHYDRVTPALNDPTNVPMPDPAGCTPDTGS